MNNQTVPQSQKCEQCGQEIESFSVWFSESCTGDKGGHVVERWQTLPYTASVTDAGNDTQISLL